MFSLHAYYSNAIQSLIVQRNIDMATWTDGVTQWVPPRDSQHLEPENYS